MLALLQSLTNHVPGWLQIIVAVLAAFQNLFIIGGIIAAYYRFIKEKPHTSRLQPTISGIAVTKAGTIYLQVNVSVENVGQVPVPIDRTATGLRVLSRKTGEGDWTFRVVESVFGRQQQAEPGATILDRVWREVPDDGEVAFMLEFFVIENKDSGWLAVEVVNLLTQGNNVLDEQHSED
jgi:hypothetical protein